MKPELTLFSMLRAEGIQVSETVPPAFILCRLGFQSRPDRVAGKDQSLRESFPKILSSLLKNTFRDAFTPLTHRARMKKYSKRFSKAQGKPTFKQPERE